MFSRFPGVLFQFWFFLLLRTALKDSPQGPPTVNRHRQPPTANRQPPTANCQPLKYRRSHAHEAESVNIRFCCCCCCCCEGIFLFPPGSRPHVVYRLSSARPHGILPRQGRQCREVAVPLWEGACNELERTGGTSRAPNTRSGSWWVLDCNCCAPGIGLLSGLSLRDIKEPPSLRSANRNKPSRGRSLLHGQGMGKTEDHRSIVEQWLAVGGGCRLAVGGGCRLAVGGS